MSRRILDSGTTMIAAQRTGRKIPVQRWGQSISDSLFRRVQRVTGVWLFALNARVRGEQVRSRLPCRASTQLSPFGYSFLRTFAYYRHNRPPVGENRRNSSDFWKLARAFCRSYG